MKKERGCSVAIETLILSYIIDGMDIATVDFPRVLMQADMDYKVVHLGLHGKLAELLVELAPSLYRKYVQVLKQLHKALNGAPGEASEL